MEANEKEELARLLVTLIKEDRDVRGAIMACARACPNIMVEY